ncbi:hypothetical protein F5X99DRAFT_407148 [Biscogniauxia marginata]|nr:hypothetical protein F5X99DRAFT_407148 [Biscogniauxia marginata]
MSSRPQWGTIIPPNPASGRPSTASRTSNPRSAHWGTYLSLAPSEAEVAAASTASRRGTHAPVSAPESALTPIVTSAKSRSARRRSPRLRHSRPERPNSTFTVSSGSVQLPQHSSQSLDSSGSSDSGQSTVTFVPGDSGAIAILQARDEPTIMDTTLADSVGITVASLLIRITVVVVEIMATTTSPRQSSAAGAKDREAPNIDSNMIQGQALGLETCNLIVRAIYAATTHGCVKGFRF